MARFTRTFGVIALAAFSAACSPEQRDTVDSAAGTAVDAARTALSVINVDLGKHVNADKAITNNEDTFAPTDTIYASVHTSGTAKNGQLTASWTFPDSSVIRQNADSNVAEGTMRQVFFITKPGGLAKGKYTFRAFVDGTEVRSKDVTVQ